MTEAEWLVSTDPQPMLELLREQEIASHRKMRLFVCACCRLIWRQLSDYRSRTAVEVGEWFADRLTASSKRLSDACHDAWRAAESAATAKRYAAALAAVRATQTPAPRKQPWPWCSHIEPWEEATNAVGNGRRGKVKSAQCRALRDIIGNPFRPISFSPAWNTPTIVALAHAAYEERALPSGELDTVRLAVLADGLEEAGCTNADILSHCRSEGPHVRGCWVVDLILGKQ